MICPRCEAEVTVYRTVDLDDMVIRKRRCKCGHRWRTVEHDEHAPWKPKKRSLAVTNSPPQGSLVVTGGPQVTANSPKTANGVISGPSNDPQGGKGGVDPISDLSGSVDHSGLEASGSEKDQGVDRPRTRSKRRPHEYQQDFITFWEAYPKKTGKGGAYVSWERQAPDLAAVLAALDWQRHSAAWLKNGGEFIPHPATYLNQRRWDDEPPKFASGSVLPPPKFPPGTQRMVDAVGGWLADKQKGGNG